MGLGRLARMSEYCSDFTAAAGEPLAGTAKRERAYVLFEWPGAWSRDVLDGGTFGVELTAKLKSALEGKAGLQLIRRPGRDGRQIGKVHRCYLAWPEYSVLEMVLLSGPEEIVELDLSGPGRNGGGVIETPLVVVCTHAKRDVCCALKGRPLAAELDEDFPASFVWETSHTKGHRFAPSVMLMPWGYSFGQLGRQAARQMVQKAVHGEYFFPSNRGSGLLSPREQVAELYIAGKLIDAGEVLHYNELIVKASAAGAGSEGTSVDPVLVTHPDGRAWAVCLEQRDVPGVVSSCGDTPTTGRVWVATGVVSGA